MDVVSPAANRLAPPRWLNGRLVAGVVLVLLSALLGAKVLAGADTRELVWAAKRDLPVGYQLTASDVAAVRVRLGATGGHYLAAVGPAPAGYVLRRAVTAGELVPGEALAAPGAADPDRRVVAVPVRPGHWPHELAPGDVVDVYATTRAAGSATPAPAVLVLRAVPVQRVPSGDRAVFGSGGSGAAVELSVPAADVVALVTAVQSGDVDLVRAPAAAPPTPAGSTPGPAGTGTAP